MWRFADAVVDSDVPFPGLPVADGRAAVIVRRGAVPAAEVPGWSTLQTWEDHQEGGLATIERGIDGYRLSFDAVRVHVSRDGSSVSYEARRDCSEPLLRHLLLHQVLPLCISRLGRVVLHACAVSTPRGVIAIVGDSGAGKSTLAAAFCARGARLTADDALVVDIADREPFDAERGGRVLAVPSADGLRLLNDLGALPRPAMEPGRPPHTGPKQHVAVPLATEPEPVVRFVLIGEISESRVGLVPLRPAEARVALLPHLFRLDVSDPGESRRLFDAVHRIALSVPARALIFPDGAAYLAPAVDAILRDLER